VTSWSCDELTGTRMINTVANSINIFNGITDVEKMKLTSKRWLQFMFLLANKMDDEALALIRLSRALIVQCGQRMVVRANNMFIV